MLTLTAEEQGMVPVHPAKICFFLALLQRVINSAADGERATRVVEGGLVRIECNCSDSCCVVRPAHIHSRQQVLPVQGRSL